MLSPSTSIRPAADSRPTSVAVRPTRRSAPNISRKERNQSTCARSTGRTCCGRSSSLHRRRRRRSRASRRRPELGGGSGRPGHRQAAHVRRNRPRRRSVGSGRASSASARARIAPTAQSRGSRRPVPLSVPQMKRCWSIPAILLVIAIPSLAHAQSPVQAGAWTISPLLGVSFDPDGDASLALAGALDYHVTPAFALEGELGHLFDTAPDNPNVDASLTTAHASVLYTSSMSPSGRTSPPGSAWATIPSR